MVLNATQIVQLQNSLFLIKITVCSSLQCLISSSGILVEVRRYFTQFQTKKPVPQSIGDILAEVILWTVRRVGHHHFSEIFVRAVRPSSISGSCTTTGMQRLCATSFYYLYVTRDGRQHTFILCCRQSKCVR